MVPTHAISHEVSPLTSGAPVALVFGLHEPSVRWTVNHLREAGAGAVALPAGLPSAAAASVVSAADACVHLLSAAQGLDGTFLEYWQLSAEAGKARYVAVYDLTAISLDVNEAAAIASRVLEEDVLVTTLPLLDEGEAAIGVLDVIRGEQWFPGGDVQEPRADFVQAVEAETNTWLHEADTVGIPPMDALREGLLAAAVTLDTHSRAGVEWLARHLPDRQVPPATTVLSSHAERAVVVAGPEGLTVGPAMALVGTNTHSVRVTALASLGAPGLVSHLEPGALAAVDIEPPVGTGTLLIAGR